MTNKTHLQSLLELDDKLIEAYFFIRQFRQLTSRNITTSQLSLKVGLTKVKTRCVCKQLVDSGFAEEFNDINGTYGKRGIQYTSR